MSATAELLKGREDWLEIVLVPNRHGAWNVAVILDGGYAQQDDARYNAESFARQIAAALAADGFPLGVPLNSSTGRPQLVDGSAQIIAADTAVDRG